VDKLKTARGASACAARRLSGKSAFWSHVRCKNHIPPKYGSYSSVPFSLQFKQLRPDYV